MKTLWLHKHDRQCLIVFCNGWGMDGYPFAPLRASAYDVLMCYDYSELGLDEDISIVISYYKEAYLVGWSMGVWAGQHLFARSYGRFRKRMAVNGTLCPINDHYGIPFDVFSSTLEHFGETARLKFYRRMCRDRENLEGFLSNQPKRGLDDQRHELEILLRTADCLPADASIYTDVVIAGRDSIIPTTNQRRFWEKKMVHLIDGSHFPFYGWRSWDEVICQPGKCGV
jgi:pimeloyl-[acyl-carrier protein] methyl ester esterase